MFLPSIIKAGTVSKNTELSDTRILRRPTLLSNAGGGAELNLRLKPRPRLGLFGYPNYAYIITCTFTDPLRAAYLKISSLGRRFLSTSTSDIPGGRRSATSMQQHKCGIQLELRKRNACYGTGPNLSLEAITRDVAKRYGGHANPRPRTYRRSWGAR